MHSTANENRTKKNIPSDADLYWARDSTIVNSQYVHARHYTKRSKRMLVFFFWLLHGTYSIFSRFHSYRQRYQLLAFRRCIAFQFRLAKNTAPISRRPRSVVIIVHFCFHRYNRKVYEYGLQENMDRKWVWECAILASARFNFSGYDQDHSSAIFLLFQFV